MNQEEIDKWLNNTLVFFSPVVVLYLLFVISNIQDGFSWSDFKLNDVVIGGMALYVLNTLLDFFKKLSAGKK